MGLKILASNPKGKASSRMRRLHKDVSVAMRCGMKHHDHAYLWNDSVLLLAFLNRVNTPEAVLRDVDGLKRKLEHLGKSYAISVKGRAFPYPGSSQPVGNHARTTVIRASSYAMANCFRIEELIGKKLRKPWYVDGRLARKIHTRQRCSKKRVKLLPGPKSRWVYVYDGYLWGGPNRAFQPTGSAGS